MPCLLGCLAISAPRFVLVLVWLCSDYLGSAYATRFWPILGFLFMPLTTLAYAFAMHYGAFEWTPIGTAAVATAVLVDVGLIKTGSSKRRKGGGGGGGDREITVPGKVVG